MRSEDAFDTFAHVPMTTKGLIMSRQRYGLLHFGVDVVLCVITGGFWLIWIFVREMRRP